MAQAQPSFASDAYAAGLALSSQGRHADAIGRFEQALRDKPDDTRVLFALGNTARALGQAASAENFYRMVLAAEPDRLEAVVNLANLLSAGGRTDDAIALLSRSIESGPEFPELWLTLGSAWRAGGDGERAAIFFREALRLRPDYPPALGNLADLLADDGDVEEALVLYRQVLKQQPHNAQARLNRAILYLISGDLQRGWRDYAYRLNVQGSALNYAHGLKRWTGKKWREGMRLLVTAEQGLGDQIAFASIMPDLARMAAASNGQVILEAEPRLVPLFARSFPDVSVHPSHIEAREGAKTAHYEWLKAGGADEAIELGSLPSILRRSLPDFPKPHAYLKPEPNEQAKWRAWFAAQGPGPFIGLCWRSGNTSGLRAQQYAPRELWADFASAAPGTLVTLQYDATPDEITVLERLSGRKILVPPSLDQKQEIDYTAAMISCLDAVVSAPTAVSWISAGLGVATFKILYKISWMSFGTDYEPFAPSCRSIMPKRRGDWADCFAQALAALNPPR